MGAIAGAVTGLIGAGVSAYSASQAGKGNKAGESADQMAGYSDAATAAAVGVARIQAKIAKEQWQRYIDLYSKPEQELVSETMKPVRESEEFISGKGSINQGYADTGANVRRLMAGRYESGSGLEEAKADTLDRSRMKDISRLESDLGSQRFSRLSTLMSLARGLSGQAQSGLSGAAGTYNSAAGTYGNLAQLYSSAANQGAAAGGSAWGGVANSFGNLANILQNTNWGGGGSTSANFPYSFTPALQPMS